MTQTYQYICWSWTRDISRAGTLLDKVDAGRPRWLEQLLPPSLFFLTTLRYRNLLCETRKGGGSLRNTSVMTDDSSRVTLALQKH